jgi:hypothetical protein
MTRLSGGLGSNVSTRSWACESNGPPRMRCARCLFLECLKAQGFGPVDTRVVTAVRVASAAELAGNDTRLEDGLSSARNVLARALGPDGAVERERWAEEGRAVVREAA